MMMSNEGSRNGMRDKRKPEVKEEEGLNNKTAVLCCSFAFCFFVCKGERQTTLTLTAGGCF